MLINFLKINKWLVKAICNLFTAKAWLKIYNKDKIRC